MNFKYIPNYKLMIGFDNEFHTYGKNKLTNMLRNVK